jgi:hypothetical protein
MLGVRDAIPSPRDLAKAEFSTLRLRLLKIAARVIETASRVRLAFAAACLRPISSAPSWRRCSWLAAVNDGAFSRPSRLSYPSDAFQKVRSSKR